MGNINVDGKGYIVGVVGNVNPAIEWQEGAVCYADGRQWFVNSTDGDKRYQLQNFGGDRLYSFYGITSSAKDFQLNTIKQGDCIEASELDTEKKYNDAVEVFELFGFECKTSFESVEYRGYMIADELNRLYSCRSHQIKVSSRKITYLQLMAIGELKRLELEKSAPKIAPDLTPDLVSNQEIKMQKNKPVVAQVMIDLTERMEIGIKTYGEALRANNGRDALQDAYEEALDLACYLKQAMIERDNKEVK